MTLQRRAADRGLARRDGVRNRNLAGMVGQSLSAIFGVSNGRHTMGVQIRKVLEAEGIIDLDWAAAGTKEDATIGSRGLGYRGTESLPLHGREIEQLACSRKPAGSAVPAADSVPSPATARTGTCERGEHQCGAARPPNRAPSMRTHSDDLGVRA